MLLSDLTMVIDNLMNLKISWFMQNGFGFQMEFIITMQIRNSCQNYSAEYFKLLLLNSDAKLLPIAEDETIDDLYAKLIPIIFNPNIDAQKVNLASRCRSN